MDRIDLSAIDADTTKRGNQSFDFVPDGDVVVGRLTYLLGWLVADTNGDGQADLRIEVQGSPVLSASDFSL